MEYAQRGKAGVLLEIKQTLTARGASLQWLSQYPGETEICFPPLCALTVNNKRAHGSLLVIELSASTRTSNAFAPELALLEAERRAKIAAEEEARRKAVRDAEEARRQALEAELARRQTIEYRQMEAKSKWDAAMAAKEERNHALDEGRTLLAMEKRNVVLHGLRSDLDRRSNLLGEVMPVRALIAGQEAGVVQTIGPSCTTRHRPIIPRVRTLPSLTTSRSNAVMLYAQASLPPAALPPPGANPAEEVVSTTTSGGRLRPQMQEGGTGKRRKSRK